MKTKYVIKACYLNTVGDKTYWNSASQEYDFIDKATRYDNKEEVYGRINTKLKEGIYQIIEIIVKE